VLHEQIHLLLEIVDFFGLAYGFNHVTTSYDLKLRKVSCDKLKFSVVYPEDIYGINVFDGNYSFAQ